MNLQNFKELKRDKNQNGVAYIKVVDKNSIYVSRRVYNFLNSNYVKILFNEKDKELVLLPISENTISSFVLTKSRKICYTPLVELLNTKERIYGEIYQKESAILFKLKK